MFSIDWLFLISTHTPMEWITDIYLAWMKALLSPIISNYNAFIQYRKDALYKVSFNGQIIYLEHILNDTFDNINRGIYIDNVADNRHDYFYNKVELKPNVYLYNLSEGGPHLYLKNKAEYSNLYDFIVMVPTAVTFDNNAMKALVNYYKLAGKRYTIQTY